jgi:hypothetical protein
MKGAEKLIGLESHKSTIVVRVFEMSHLHSHASLQFMMVWLYPYKLDASIDTFNSICLDAEYDAHTSAHDLMTPRRRPGCPRVQIGRWRSGVCCLPLRCFHA